MSQQSTSIALVGIGGYGGIYTSALLDEAAGRPHARFLAAADPVPAACKRLAEVQARGVPVHPSLRDLLAHHAPDLVVIASPIFLHCEHTVTALRAGAHVLCEKPLCVTPQQAARMMAARDAVGRQVAIGYQWSFSPAIQRLKQDVMSGALGAPRRLKTLALWPRDAAYYGRNGWAGRRLTPSGEPVMDSPANNACAHFLHNMLYVLGDRTDRSAVPAMVTAELYRAHPVETYDTAAIRCRTTEGVELLFVVSHATQRSRGPVFHYEFDDAVVSFGDVPGGRILARFADGRVKDYGAPAGSSDAHKLWSTLDAISTGKPVLCGIEAAGAQTQVIDAANLSMPDAAAFPAGLVHTAGGTAETGPLKTWVDGLDRALLQCYEQWRLPSECGATWAEAGDEVRVAELSTDADPLAADEAGEPVMQARAG